MAATADAKQALAVAAFFVRRLRRLAQFFCRLLGVVVECGVLRSLIYVVCLQLFASRYGPNLGGSVYVNDNVKSVQKWHSLGPDIVALEEKEVMAFPFLLRKPRRRRVK